MKQLTGKIFITGLIESKTGLHIGGAKTSLDIGGIDLNSGIFPKRKTSVYVSQN
jgi:CRISPR/Cas system CSM-associated protein Csm3 (group 7 of RAMP superfamily)